MISGTRRFATLVTAAVLGAGTALVGAAAGAEPQARLDPGATKVVGKCKPGKGKIALTVLPLGAGSYEVTVKASRLPEDSRWRGDLIAFSDNGGEASQTFRRRAAEGTWSITRKLTFEDAPGQAVFFVEARGSGDEGGDVACFVGGTSGQPAVVGFTLCAKGFTSLLLRRRDDGTLVVKHRIDRGARDARWRLNLTVDSAEDSQSVTFDALSNRRGVVKSQVEFTAVPEDPVFTMRATGEHGARCRIRINPGPLTAAVTGQSGSPRQLLGRLAG